jgi:hypothetical protein
VNSTKRSFHFPMQISPRYLQYEQGEGFGKLYVTNSEFPNGIGLLCVVILYLFFLSVKGLGLKEAGGNGRSP